MLDRQSIAMVVARRILIYSDGEQKGLRSCARPDLKVAIVKVWCGKKLRKSRPIIQLYMTLD